MSGRRNGTGREAGSSQVEAIGKKADIRTSFRWQEDCPVVHLGYSLGNMKSSYGWV